jgi:hypothetical protein
MAILSSITYSEYKPRSGWASSITLGSHKCHMVVVVILWSVEKGWEGWVDYVSQSPVEWGQMTITCQHTADGFFLLLNKRSVCQLRSDDCANPLYISLLLIRLWRWGYKFSRKASCMLVSILYLSCVQNTISRGSVNIGLDDVVKTIVLQSVFSTALWVRSINCTSRRWPAFWHTCL